MSAKDLGELLVDEEELNRELLYTTLSPFICISKTSNKIIPTENYSELSEKNKILVFLLAKKAMKILNLGVEKESANPTEVSQNTGVKYGTVKPTLSYLARENILAKNSTGYYVPNYNLIKMRNTLDKLSK